MIRPLVILLLGPGAVFWSWYFLSLNDLSFGLPFFSRELHDQVFVLYGQLLGVDPAAIPGMAAKALAFDGVVVLALVAWRKRAGLDILAGKLLARPRQSCDASLSAESLSSAP